MNEQRVIMTMRRILREQVTDSSMDKATVRYIFDNNLIRFTQWPGWLMSLTDAGRDYINEHSEEAA